ncbi:MAG: hypothetical protein Q8N88_06740 [Nanoarchaeota archaeon]|nr:hypothetical protein [Nanoarchaeota archaeon]
MRNLLGLKIETKVSLLIVIMFVAIFLVTVFKSINNFNKFSEQINQYEKLRVEKGK